jgi:serine O-acetyltransferase
MVCASSREDRKDTPLGFIRETIKLVRERDPAVKTSFEAILCYPGMHALWIHRISHFLYRRRLFTLARIVSHINRFLTGVEIHPGAKIGKRVFIDHGMGIVIGETAEVGDGCTLYKGIVLGGTSLVKKKRHPTVGKGVIIGSNAVVLGPVKIGDGAMLGSGSVTITDVPPCATVVGVPGKVLASKDIRAILSFEHGNLPDPLDEILKTVLRIDSELEKRIERLEKEHGITSPKVMLNPPEEIL